ncbi:SMC-Scp complex subunit ScpB [Candidatus Uhrbacteria bacterium CG_4_9_14_3_um_filter_50_9]|uniref:SMC-Scp complex subunit ScpB n=1 Tax=Candidatus Uhrbacteria bacterium CG_4_9_14_3_um_filter_50_9 TaxID=1975035 RepID=A0A2M7XEK3_9BACT|nr:MAG: SMC-Scp complex subunit ScpB [Candidatus Uhrbacteria bacterium CG_4_9_14_3_um_filter_50_9]
MITATVEAILFAAAKPLAIGDLSKNLDVSKEVIQEAIEELRTMRNVEGSGIHLLDHDGKVQLVSNPVLGEDVAKFLKKEASGPLTRPSLETLTIIAYRGPITKPEIEVIRGVNCSLIIRNLLIRGYVNEEEDRERLQPVYTLSNEFMQALGLTSIDQLPDYETFIHNEKITELLQGQTEEFSEEV